MKNNMFILKPFNGTFWMCFFFFILLLVISTLILKGKPLKVRKTVFVTACLITFVGFFIYKYYLSIDKEYDMLRGFIGGFSWWSELPLHLCNINMMLMPIAVLTNNRKLMGLSFFLAPLGALMALVMPGVGFSDCSIFEPRMLGYFGTHFMIMIEGIALVTYGFYKPKFKDLPMVTVYALILSICIHVINLTFRLGGLYDRANYFYTMETEQNFLLDIFYKFIPIPYLYLMPCLLILAVYMCLVTLPFEIFGKKKDE